MGRYGLRKQCAVVGNQMTNMAIANLTNRNMSAADSALSGAVNLAASAAAAEQAAADRYAVALLGKSVAEALAARAALDAAKAARSQADALVRVLASRTANALHVTPIGLREAPWSLCFRETRF